MKIFAVMQWCDIIKCQYYNNHISMKGVVIQWLKLKEKSNTK